jgi:nucleoid DNA-binding protein
MTKTTRKTTAAKELAKKKAPAKITAAKKVTAKKTVAKKTLVTKVATKKTTAKKVEASKTSTKPLVFKDPLNKTGLIRTITEVTELPKKDVTLVLESLIEVIKGHVSPKAAGKFTLPGLMTVKVTNKPAVKAHKGINRLTGLETMFKAKPARRAVKIKALKKLKEAADKK